MSPTPVVRDARPEDLAAVQEIYDEQVAGAVSTFDTTAPPPAYWQQRLADPHPFLVAVDGSRVVGFAYASTYRPRAAYDRTREVSVYLAAQARGRGVGRALYDVLLGRLRADGVHTVLAVVATPNPASEALHRSCGFSQVGLLPEVGHKLGRWVDTGLWALVLDDPVR